MDIVEEKKQAVMEHLNIKDRKNIVISEDVVFHYPCRFYFPEDKIGFDVFTEMERDYMVYLELKECLDSNHYMFTMNELRKLLMVSDQDMYDYIKKERKEVKDNVLGLFGGLFIRDLVDKRMSRAMFYQKLFHLLKEENRFGTLLANYNHVEIKHGDFYLYRVL